MLEDPDRWELDVIPPLNSVTITLDVSPPELELAVATNGVSLCPAMMRAIVAAMVVEVTLRPARFWVFAPTLSAQEPPLVGPDMAAIAEHHPFDRDAKG
jgi:hypothetical protein